MRLLGPPLQDFLIHFVIGIIALTFCFSPISYWSLQKFAVSHIHDVFANETVIDKKCFFPGNSESFHPGWHPQSRMKRFPGVSERVKLYMSSWYHAPCHYFRYQYVALGKNGASPVVNVTYKDSKSCQVNILMRPDKIILIQNNTIQQQSSSESVCNEEDLKALSNLGLLFSEASMCRYYSDMVGLFKMQMKLSVAQPRAPPPILACFSDTPASRIIHENYGKEAFLPVFAKYRKGGIISQTDLDTNKQISTANESICVGLKLLGSPIAKNEMHPILWKLNSKRHWAPVYQVESQDTPWRFKKSVAAWRGELTGEHTFSLNIPPIEKCKQNTRCNFVLKFSLSHTANVGATGAKARNISGVDGSKIWKEKMSMKELLQHKMIISLEGNDVASGLKWQLYSNSVVLMPAPTWTSWAMEELLEPWVHYVPLDRDGGNVEQRVQWVLRNDEKAHRIAERATLFMFDMLFHPDAQGDEDAIKTEIIHRYQNLWFPADNDGKHVTSV